jgi:hypothetical protein
MESEMARTHHLSMTGAVIVCLVSAQGNGTLFASEDEGLLREAPSSQSLTSSASETQVSTSGGLVPAIAIDNHSAGTDLGAAPLPQMERSPFTPSVGGLTANPSLGLAAPGARRTFGLAPTESSALARQIYPGRPYRIRRDGSIAALMIGAVATIAGTSVLVYAHRPECESNHFAGGCGYGTKVVGGAVLTGGIVGLFVGALTWR